MQELFVAIRSSATSAIWSGAVRITRTGKLQQESSSAEGELKISVTPSGQSITLQVRLWPDEEDWNCDCGSTDDPCEHVAAAIIALKAATDKGEQLPSAEDSSDQGEIRYCFHRKNQSLSFSRIFFQSGEGQLLQLSLASLSSGRVQGPKVRPTREDMTVDHLIDNHRHGGVLPTELMQTLIASLAECPRVWLDDEPIHCSAKRSGPMILVEDRGLGKVLVRSQAAPGITEVFINGAALAGKTLHPFIHPGSLQNQLQLLSEGRIFRPNELAELSSHIIPELRKQLPVEIRSRQLPDSCTIIPHLIWDSQKQGEELRMRPMIVYGSPPLAHIEDDKLIPRAGSKQIPVRLIAEETRLQQKISREWSLQAGDSLHFRGAEAVDFLRRLEEKGEEISGAGQRAFRLRPALLPKIRGTLSADEAFSLQFSSAGQSKISADPAVVFQAWERGESMVPLFGQEGWAEIPRDWLNRYGDRIRDLLVARQENETLPPCQKPALASLYQDLDLPLPMDLTLWKNMADDFTQIPEAILPAGFRARLRSYQKHGISWLQFLREQKMGALLADDMGLGKTLQAISIMQSPTLVVCPTSVLYNWQSELERFYPGLSVSIYHGAERSLNKPFDVILTSYALLRSDLAELRRKHWKVVILDEAQTIKNPESQSAQAAYALDADFRLALSGTPVENKPEDLWSLFHFINRGLLGSLSQFRKRYTAQLSQEEKPDQNELRKKIRPFVLRRLKSEVARELPPKTERNLYCELNEAEWSCYHSLLLAGRQEIAGRLADNGSMIPALELLLRLRQAACHTGLLPGHHGEASSSKLRLIIRNLQDSVENNHKTLLFSQWTTFLDLIAAALRQAGLSFLRIDGKTQSRSDIVRKFQESQEPLVLLLSLKAAGTGLNLTAAEHVMIADPWWNPAVEEQATDRAHRIGQEHPVLISRLIAKNTVEEKIQLLKERKRKLADSVVTEQNDGSALSRTDLLALLDD
ncbi:MAG: DEAD/DEAH box helicase [Deltaproteobacteria bacterium]|nr:DEAD/DEAH box helicase [Deltaproteobacteria bacterium]